MKQRLLARFWTRFHMSLILLSCGLSAMLANTLMRWAGVDAMLVRYPVAVLVSYLTFLAGVWVWLRYVGIKEPERKSGDSSNLLDSADLPDIPIGRGGGGSGGGSVFSGKGGSFDGGGASASWAEAGSARMPLVASSSSSESGGIDLPDLGSVGDADELALVLLALAVVAAIVLSSGYLIWMAPDILAEAAFGALLAGGLARPAKREDAAGWMAGVAKKTWWPFAIVMVLALAFAGYAASQYPKARTFGEALEMAGKPDKP